MPVHRGPRRARRSLRSSSRRGAGRRRRRSHVRIDRALPRGRRRVDLGLCAGLVAARRAASSCSTTTSRHRCTRSRIDQPDDILALVAFVAVSLLVGATVARLEPAPPPGGVHAAARRRCGSTLTNELAPGRRVERGAATPRRASSVTLFDLRVCTVTAGDGRRPRAPTAGIDILIGSPPLRRLELALERWHSATRRRSPPSRAGRRGRHRDRARRLDSEHASSGSAASSTGRAPASSPRSPTICAPHSPRSRRPPARCSPPTHALDDAERRELARSHVRRGGAARRTRHQGARADAGSAAGAVRPEPVIDRRSSTWCTSRRPPGAVEPSTTDASTLDLDPDLPAVHVDVLLMEHVLVNLLENAAAARPDRAPIEIRGCGPRPRRFGARRRRPRSRHPVGRPGAHLRGVRPPAHAPTDGAGHRAWASPSCARSSTRPGRSVRCEETPGRRRDVRRRAPGAETTTEEHAVSAVLLVEDDRLLRRALRASFRNWHFDVTEAESGEEALDASSSDAPPDLVVLDLTLPGIDGLETLRHLRTFTDVPVVVLTVRDSPARQGRRARLGRRRLRAQAVRARGAARPCARAPPPVGAPTTSRAVVRVGRARDRPRPRQVTWRGEPVQLTPDRAPPARGAPREPRQAGDPRAAPRGGVGVARTERPGPRCACSCSTSAASSTTTPPGPG